MSVRLAARRRLGNLRERRDDEAGQMAVELALCIPIVIIVGAIALDLIMFMGDCARFDRVAAEAIRVEGISPGYESYGRAACEAAVAEAIEAAFAGRDDIEIEVSSSEVGSLTGTDYGGSDSSGGLLFSFVPTHRRYTCTMRSSAVFLGDGVFGFSFPALEHSYVLTVDSFEPQPWM